MGAISSKGTPNMSCRTRATRSAGVSVSSTMSRASPTDVAAIILWIATTNVFNRINVTVRQPAGS
jgi:hypothetical protein